MTSKIKKIIGLIGIFAMALTVLYIADTPAVQAEIQDTAYERTSDNTTDNNSLEVIGCILGSVFSAISEVQTAQTPVAVVSILLDLAINIIECTDTAGDYAMITCSADAILDMVVEVTECTDYICVVSSIFDLILDLITCAESTAAVPQ